MAYLVASGHSPKKLKRAFENIGKMTRTEARVKKQGEINKNTIILPAEYNPRGLDVNADIKRHEHILQHNTVLKELFPTNSFIVANKRAKKVRELVSRTYPYNIKLDLLDQANHGHEKCGRKCDCCNNFVLEKNFLYVLLEELNLRFVEIAQRTVKSVTNKVLDLVWNGNHD